MKKDRCGLYLTKFCLYDAKVGNPPAFVRQWLFQDSEPEAGKQPPRRGLPLTGSGGGATIRRLTVRAGVK